MDIKFTDITKKYGSKYAVNDVNFTLSNGVCALLGANGSGKTTLMRMLADVLRPTSGSISLDGHDIRILDSAYRDLLGYLPQNFGYYKDFKAYDFLKYMCALKGINSSFAKEKCIEMLEYVGLIEEKDKKIKTFSGGMRQRLGIAQALLNDPSILILDEPTAGLDPKERIRFRNLMNEISKDKVIIYATHIVSDISFIADRIIIMKDGKIAADNTPSLLLSAMQGKVWLIEADRDEIPLIQNTYTAGEISSSANGKLLVRVISENSPSGYVQKAEPSLDDVYLHYFGEVSDNGSNDKI